MKKLGPTDIANVWFERVWNQGDETAIDELVAPDCVAHNLPTPDGEPIRGPEAFKTFTRAFREALPDIHIRVTKCVTEGTLCVAHCDVKGTHTGDALGFPATGNKVHFTGTATFHVLDGQIQEGWNSFDFLKFYQQVGLVPKL